MAVTLPAAPIAVPLQRAGSWGLQSTASGDEDELFVLLVLGFGLGCYMIDDGFDTWQLARLVQDTPTSTVRSMAVGRVELQGTARKHDRSVTPPLADAECVYVDWEAEKRERRVDSDGDVHHEWVTIAQGERTLAFDLEDDTGSALVRADLDDPEFDVNRDEHRHGRTYGSGESAPDDVRWFVESKGAPDATAIPTDADDGGFFDDVAAFASDLATDSLDDTGHRRRYVETVLPVGSHAYVFGSAEPREGASMEDSEADLLEVRRDPGTDEFLVSDSTEARLQDSYSRWGPIETIGGLALSAGCLFVLLRRYRLHELLV